VAEKVNSINPPKLAPRITLRLGQPIGIEYTVDQEHGNKHMTIISMPEWNKNMFGLGVAMSASSQILDIKTVVDATNEGLGKLQKTLPVDVKELKK
jgi:hypothetical protein